MAYVQKDIGMGAINVSVQTDVHQTFQIVPENPHLLDVDMNFLLFVTPQHPNIRIDNPVDTVIYRVEEDGAALTVEQYPLS